MAKIRTHSVPIQFGTKMGLKLPKWEPVPDRPVLTDERSANLIGPPADIPGYNVGPDPGPRVDQRPRPLGRVVDGEGQEVVDEHGRLDDAHADGRRHLLGGGGPAFVLVAHGGLDLEVHSSLVEIPPVLVPVPVLCRCECDD